MMKLGRIVYYDKSYKLQKKCTNLMLPKNMSGHFRTYFFARTCKKVLRSYPESNRGYRKALNHQNPMCWPLHFEVVSFVCGWRFWSEIYLYNRFVHHFCNDVFIYLCHLAHSGNKAIARRSIPSIRKVMEKLFMVTSSHLELLKVVPRDVAGWHEWKGDPWDCGTKWKACKQARKS